MFRQEGREADGWRGSPFWWPVLFAPTNSLPSIFASTVRKNNSELPEDDPAPSDQIKTPSVEAA